MARDFKKAEKLKVDKGNDITKGIEADQKRFNEEFAVTREIPKVKKIFNGRV